jgi:hypothetical protein
MKYICMCFTVLLGRMMDAFTPIYRSISENTRSIVKSFSGIFTSHTSTPISLYEKSITIIPGYMEHDPKKEAKKKWTK